MKRILFAAAVAALLTTSACKTPQAEETPSDSLAVDSVNALSEAEQSEGWTLLFNGQDLSGWTGYKSDSLPGKWTVEDGALAFDGERPGSGGDLVSEKSYDDFELSFEWKISDCGNSGVIYRSDVSDMYEAPWNTGPEYQILDNSCHADAAEGTDRQAGANYDMNGPTSDVTNPAGEWNTAVIKVDSAQVEHWLNGQQVVSYELWSDQWKQDVAGSKWAEHPDYGTQREGHITLQDHGDRVWYRNIKIREL